MRDSDSLGQHIVCDHPLGEGTCEERVVRLAIIPKETERFLSIVLARQIAGDGRIAGFGSFQEQGLRKEEKKEEEEEERRRRRREKIQRSVSARGTGRGTRHRDTNREKMR